MFDRETRRAKVLEARGRAKRDQRGRSAPGDVEILVEFLFCLFDYLKCRIER